MDIFTWSIPFVAEKSTDPHLNVVTEMLYHIISGDEDQHDDDDEIQQKDIEKFKELTKQSTSEKKEYGGEVVNSSTHLFSNHKRLTSCARRSSSCQR
jgi:serine/threonine-protein phosphatase 2B catalytic subunit